jgi:hypothetical protein
MRTRMIDSLTLLNILRAGGTAGLALLGVVAKPVLVFLSLQVQGWQFPMWVMQLFQLGAWAAAIVAGAFTCYGVWRVHHGKKRGRR